MRRAQLPPATRYLPLVPRPRPAALPLQQRVTELHNLLHQADHTLAPEEQVARACEVMNKAALIASDTGHPGLATTLCWQQYETFTLAARLTAKAATFALQPLVNLARLAIRTGDPSGAYAVLGSLFEAADRGGPANVLGRSCPVGDLVATPSDRAELRRFLWAVLLADGTRALCAAGRWQDAMVHLHRYNGIGARLLDGRQVAVLAALHLHDPDTATGLLAATDCSEAWERAVAACLNTATDLVAGRDAVGAITTMVDAVQHLPPTPGGAVFAARLGVLACELDPDHHALAAHVIVGARESADTHAATAVLESAVLTAQLSEEQSQALRERVAQAQPAGTQQSIGLGKELAGVGDRAAAFLTDSFQTAGLV
ncbi:hypothetical protein [Nocardiopsis metallicus]|uniref:Uncharacterized protein n=1 Tax=Nocardiopsis metallicus TaxID=179819 RepID=A0A840W614_9ACTN|nr:hypothetical protein [Nocardiopsis metallicus]MBB5491444.1 hypothetical protein [Nocardiopsis metallicus]